MDYETEEGSPCDLLTFLENEMKAKAKTDSNEEVRKNYALSSYYLAKAKMMEAESELKFLGMDINE